MNGSNDNKVKIWDVEKIRNERERAGLLVKDAAAIFGVTPEYLSMVENGHRQPGPELLVKASRQYKRKLCYFLRSEKKLSLS